MKTAKQILIDAKELISNPVKWTTRFWARNAAGKPITSYSPEACQWCSWGALMKVQAGGDINVAYQTLTDFMYGNIAAFNDSPNTTHADVMARFDRAIESL